MASAYQPTTIEREQSEPNANASSCNPFHGRRQRHDSEPVRGHDTNEAKHDDQHARNERVNQWLFSRCISKQDGQIEDGSAVPTPAGSENNFPVPTTVTMVPSKLNRAQTLKKKFVKSTENFFGLGDCDEQHQNLQRKWTQRKKRHYSKRYGALVEVVEDAVDAAASQAESRATGPASVSSFQSSHAPDPALVRTMSRRQSVAHMAWKKMRKLKEESASFQSPGKPQPVSTLLDAGRSFSPAVMSQTVDDEIDSAFHSETAVEAHEVDDDVFFNFTAERPRRKKEKAGFLPGIHEEEEKPPSLPVKEGEDEVEGPPRPPLRSTRGQRIADRPRVTNANRRVYGKGLMGRWLNRTIKRKRLTSTVRKQMESLADHRPFFTYWVSFVQIIVLIVGLAVYGIAPIGFTETQDRALVETSQKGTLVPTFLVKSVPDNFWIGPNQASLIRMGAKFAPCMRSDNRLAEVLQEEKLVENESGCCIKSDNSGCIQTSRAECSKAFAYFYKYSKKYNKSRVVCGQDPHTCLDPASVEPYEWNPTDITKWPECKKSKPNLPAAEYPHMRCDITGRPCCMGNEAKCKIISRDECKFEGGRYHENATLCSQVDCLKDTCGMLNFQNKEQPDQVYRLWMAIFAHAGVIHLVCTLLFHFTIMRDLEKMAGWLRLSIIYIFSGIGGYLYSAILLPYQAEVGPSGSVFGIIACLFVELFQSWQMIAKPFTALFKLCGIVLLLLLIGLLPYVDNFAHMIGFVFGLLLAFIFLPYLSFGKWDRRRKQIQILVCFTLVITLFTVGFLVFYIGQETSCSGCEYLNCVPFTIDFCKPYNLGQKLQPR